MKHLQLGLAGLAAFAGSSVGFASDNCGPPIHLFDSCIFAQSVSTASGSHSTRVEIVIPFAQVNPRYWSTMRRLSRVGAYSYSQAGPEELSKCRDSAALQLSIPFLSNIEAEHYDDWYSYRNEDPFNGFTVTDRLEHLSAGNVIPTGDNITTDIQRYELSVSQGTPAGIKASGLGFSAHGCNLNTAKSKEVTTGSVSARVLAAYDIDASNLTLDDLGRIDVRFKIQATSEGAIHPAWKSIPGYPPETQGCSTPCWTLYENAVGVWHTGSSCVLLKFSSPNGAVLYSGLISAGWKNPFKFVSPLDNNQGLPTIEPNETQYHNDFSQFASNSQIYPEITEQSLTLRGDQMGANSPPCPGDFRTHGCGPSSWISSIPRELSDLSTDPGNSPDPDGRQLRRDRSATNYVSVDLKKLAQSIPNFPLQFTVEVMVVQQTVPWSAGGGWAPNITSPHYAGLAASLAHAGGAGCTSAFFTGGYANNNPDFPSPPPLDPRLPCNADIVGPGQSGRPDGEYTPDDIIMFLNRFFAGDFRADISGPGQNRIPDGQFTADDIIVYFNCFFVASPPYPPDGE